MFGAKPKERAGSPSGLDKSKRHAGLPEMADRTTETHPLLLPEKLAAEWWIAAGIFALSLAYLCLFRRYLALDPDEGIILQGAQRILQGQVLYRDFFSFVTPGSYYFLALLFKTFGSSMLVARTALAVYGALFSVFTYLSARRVCSRWAALAAAYLVTLTSVPWRFMVLHNWDSTLLACAAVYCAVWLLQAPRWGWAIACGSFASLTVLFDHSKGAGLMLGFALGLALLVLFARSAIRLSRGHWVALGIGLAWPFAVTLAYFGVHHALPAMWADWAWPLQHYTQVNSVPYGYQDWSDETRSRVFGSGPWLVRGLALFTVSPCFLIPVLPIISTVLLVYWLLQSRKGALRTDRAAYYILICSALVGLLSSAIVVREDIIHFVYFAPLCYLVLAWIMEGTDIHGGLVSFIKPLVTVGVLITFTAVGMAFLVTSRNARTVIETRRGMVMADSSDEILTYVQAHVPAGSRIFVYPYLPLYYYLTATFSATRYEYLQPGMHTRAQDEEAIREIEGDRTSAVLLELAFNGKIPSSWPNTPLQFVANDPVGDYLLAHYHSCRILTSAAGWRFLYMVRKDLACPDKSPPGQMDQSD
jgi:Dolichyl-phosphate-mannose-protein mannosyltransferase